MIADPVNHWDAADQVEQILLEVEKDNVPDHKSIGCAGYELLRPVHTEIREAIDPKVGQELHRVRPLQQEFGHVIGLIKKDAGLLPSPLFIPPIREFGRNAWVNV